jgi:hypothetical protein
MAQRALAERLGLADRGDHIARVLHALIGRRGNLDQRLIERLPGQRAGAGRRRGQGVDHGLVAGLGLATRLIAASPSSSMDARAAESKTVWPVMDLAPPEKTVPNTRPPRRRST